MQTGGHRTIQLSAATMLLAALSTLGVASAQAPPSPVGVAKTVTRFSEALPLAAGAKPMQIVVKDWFLVRGRTIELPAQGFYLAQLRSGTVITNIGGKNTNRVPGDFWTVSAGTPLTMTIRPPGEAALLRTIEINPVP